MTNTCCLKWKRCKGNKNQMSCVQLLKKQCFQLKVMSVMVKRDLFIIEQNISGLLSMNNKIPKLGDILVTYKWYKSFALNLNNILKMRIKMFNILCMIE